MITIANLLSALESFAPLSLAAEWDNVGLLLGDASARVERVMTCLTVTPESVDEAIRERAQLIVSHHPILFRAAKKLTTNTPEGRMLWSLAQAGIAVYSPHTAYDNCADGINDQLARKLNLSNLGPLRSLDAPRQAKIVVFVPDKDLVHVSDAMFAAGAGHIGEYRECSFRLAGTGTFFGGEASNPTIGAKGRREDVAEWRLEVLCPDAKVERVVQAMRAAHSYEEPAYDVYSLRPERAKLGEGRCGMLPTSMPLDEFGRLVKTALSANCVQIVGANKSVQRIAIACGAAGEFLNDAVRQKADVFLTGEVRFHDCLTAQAQGVAMVLPGHYVTERGGVETLALRLQQQFPTLYVWPSRAESEPLRLV